MRPMLAKDGDRILHERCRACPRPIRAGQSVLVASLPNDVYESPYFVLHTECAAGLVAEAPAGTPVTSKRAKVARFRQAAERVAAGANPFEAARSA